jgi:hypothetical protein
VQDLDGQVLALLIANLPRVSAHDRPRTVMRVDDLLANFVQGVSSTSLASNAPGGPPQTTPREAKILSDGGFFGRNHPAIL